MFGWRARIGYVCPGVHLYSQEWDKILPEGVVWVVASLGIRSVTPEEFDRIFGMYIAAGEMVASGDADIIICGGGPVQLWKGYDKSLEMARRMQDVIEALREAGSRDKVWVMIGGAPVTQDFADSIGADAYAPDGPSAVDKAKELLQQH